MSVAVFMVMTMPVVLGVMVRCGARRLAVLENIDFGGPEAAARHAVDAQLRADAERGGSLLEQFRGNACIEESAQQHVSGNARKTLDSSALHGDFQEDRAGSRAASISGGSSSFIEPER